MNPVALVKRCGHAVLALFLLSPAVSSAQVKVIMSGGFATPYKEVLPSFEKTTGISVTTTSGPSQGTGPNTIGAQLRRGVPADVVIMNREGLSDLAAEGRLAPGTIVDIARVPMGLAVSRGAPKPDLSTLESFKKTLRDAKAIASASSATIYLTSKLLPALGMDSLTTKILNTGKPAVASGEADVVILPVSELLHAPEVDFVGAIPEEAQHISVFSAAILNGTTQSSAAKQLIAFLTAPTAHAAIKNSGMEPANKQ